MGLAVVFVLVAVLVFPALSLVVEWKDAPVVVRVPKYSVLTVELPCPVYSVVNLSSLVEVGIMKKAKVNSVHIAVKQEATSVGITCKNGESSKSYNIFIKPSESGGTTFLKIVDPSLPKESGDSLPADGSPDSSLLEHAEKLMVSMLMGRRIFGYKIYEKGETFTRMGLRFVPVRIYAGRLVGVVYRVRNVSPIRKALSPEMFSGHGTVLVWVEGAEDKNHTDLRPGEEVYVAVVRLRGDESVQTTMKGTDLVIPFR